MADELGRSHEALARYRDEFPILERTTYLNSCSLGALSQRSMDAMGEFMELWNSHGASAWYEIWWRELQNVRDAFAELIGAGGHEVAIQPNVSVALSSIASALDFHERPKVVMTELDFPTVFYQWMVKRNPEIELVVLESEDGISVELEKFENAIDERTALVSTSRVFFTTGYIQDIGAITELAHAQGAQVCVDDYQGTGQVPIDVRHLNVDHLVTGGLKWLLGGPGIAFHYVREDLIERLEPTMTGWFANAHQFEFKPQTFAFRDDATRFEQGTPALAPVYAARGGLEIVREIGVARLRERTSYLTTDLIERACDRGFRLRVADDEYDRAGIVMAEMEAPDQMVKALAERNIVVDYRPGAVRISPYFYNTTEENERILDAIEAIRAADSG